MLFVVNGKQKNKQLLLLLIGGISYCDSLWNRIWRIYWCLCSF